MCSTVFIYYVLRLMVANVSFFTCNLHSTKKSLLTFGLKVKVECWCSNVNVPEKKTNDNKVESMSGEHKRYSSCICIFKLSYTCICHKCLFISALINIFRCQLRNNDKKNGTT